MKPQQVDISAPSKQQQRTHLLVTLIMSLNMLTDG